MYILVPPLILGQVGDSEVARGAGGAAGGPDSPACLNERLTLLRYMIT